MFKGTAIISGSVLISSTGSKALYDAVHECTLLVTRHDRPSGSVACSIIRQERCKTIDGQERLSDTETSYPDNIHRYLEKLGACIEEATGTYDAFTRVLVIRSASPRMIRPSSVVWDPHLYALVVTKDGRGLAGPAFSLDSPDGRACEVGSVDLTVAEPCN